MLKEEWKDVKGYEGLYQISNYGNLKHYTSRYGWRTLKETNKKGWYYTVNLRGLDGKAETKRIHRLVAEHFIGEIPIGYHIHHKDGNKQNNIVTNLEIIHPKNHVQETIKQNPHFLDGMIRYNRYERPRRVRQYTLNGDFLAEFANCIIASEHTGVCSRNILRVANGEENRKQAGGFVWKFANEGVIK